MTVQDRQDPIQKRAVAKQSQDNAENIDPALLTEQPRSGRVKHQANVANVVYLRILLGHVVCNAGATTCVPPRLLM
jgi:hypothetical protein